MVGISSQKGILIASSDVSFTFSYRPKDRLPRKISAELYLLNLPEKSLVSKSEVKIINGVEAIKCLVVNIKTRPSQSSVLIRPLHKQIISPVYKSIPVKDYFIIENHSSSRRNYKI